MCFDLREFFSFLINSRLHHMKHLCGGVPGVRTLLEKGPLGWVQMATVLKGLQDKFFLVVGVQSIHRVKGTRSRMAKHRMKSWC